MLRRLNVFGEIVYKTRNFVRLQHNCNSMQPRVPASTKRTIRTTVDDFYTGDLVAVRSPADDAVHVRQIAATPGTQMVSADDANASFTLDANKYWVSAVQPGAPDSSDWGPIDAADQILGRAVHCSTTSHLINNSDAGKAADKEDNWVVPLVPNSMRDLAILWKMTANPGWVSGVLPSEHPLSQPTAAVPQPAL